MYWSNFRYRCDYCNKDLGEAPLENYRYIYHDIKEQGKRGHFCNKECYDKYKQQFEIIYKDKIMYKMDDKEYVPYIGCLYYFKTAEDCYQRMGRRVGIYF